MSLPVKNWLLWTGMTLASAGSVSAAAPTAEQALQLSPVQKGVDIDQPAPADIAKCTVKAEKVGNHVGWLVLSADGQPLRNFRDNNGDNVVDQWSYYKEGLEVYRDIDANYNGKADQYRWFHTGGTRWGMDANEDGSIDTWKVISAEEAAAEATAALQSRDMTRFGRLLLTGEELKALGLGAENEREVDEKISAAPGKFRTLALAQKALTKTTKFMSFSGMQPGAIPAGTSGSTKDLVVYENVAAILETDGKPQQLQVGTLIRIDDVWRLIDAPQIGGDEELAARTYSFMNYKKNVAAGGPSQAGAEKMQKFITELDDLDAAINGAKPEKQAELHAQRVDLLERMAADEDDAAQQSQWLKQIADSVSAAVQSGSYPDGVDRLTKLEEKLAKSSAEHPMVAYVRFRRLSASYSRDLQQPKAEFAKIQEKWIGELEEYVKAFPKGADAPEAMLQLAIAQEFAGEDDKAIEWYTRIARDFPMSMPARKATGAKTRLESVGKEISLRGPTLEGKALDLAQFRGRPVVIQYWATWCEPCKADMAILKELLAKHGAKNVAVIGVSLDNSKEEAAAFVRQEKLPWPHVYEAGGLESRPANELGVLTLPTMLLLDSKGKVVNRNIHGSEIDSELKKLIK